MREVRSPRHALKASQPANLTSSKSRLLRAAPDSASGPLAPKLRAFRHVTTKTASATAHYIEANYGIRAAAGNDARGAFIKLNGHTFRDAFVAKVSACRSNIEDNES